MILWPGLTGVWLRGNGLDLALAVMFAGALDLALVTSLTWPQLFSRELPPWGVPGAAWVLVLWFWVMGWGRARGLLAAEAAKSLQPDEASEELFREAQLEYLKGHWLEAKTLLAKILARRPGDAESRLLLVSVCRRRGEIELAHQQLAELSRMPRAWFWQEEIAAERQKLARAGLIGDSPGKAGSAPAIARAA